MSTKRIMIPSTARPERPDDRAVQRPDDDRDQRGEEPDLERCLAPEHDPPELVEPVLVGPEGPACAAERAGRARRQVGLAAGWVSVWFVW